MAKQLQPPFYTSEVFKALKSAEKQFLDVLPTIDKLESCGVECHEMRANAQHYLDQTRLIEQNFFSPPPK